MGRSSTPITPLARRRRPAPAASSARTGASRASAAIGTSQSTAWSTIAAAYAPERSSASPSGPEAVVRSSCPSAVRTSANSPLTAKERVKSSTRIWRSSPSCGLPPTHDGQWSFYRAPASRLHRQCIARVACRTMWPPVEHPIGTPWRLELLGPPRLTGPDGPVDVAAPKANLLLWLVAGHWPAAVSRGWLTNALYPDVPEREARRNLTNLLSRLGHWLPPRPLRAELDRLRWDEAAGVALDLAELTTRAAAADADSMEAAARLWRGPFLEGVSPDGSEELEDWLRMERRRWSERYVELLDRLVDGELAAGRAREAEAWARRALVEEPAAERFHRVRILARRESGDRAGALAAFDEYVRAMADLGLAPDARMAALRDEIARGNDGRAAQP